MEPYRVTCLYICMSFCFPDAMVTFWNGSSKGGYCQDFVWQKAVLFVISSGSLVTVSLIQSYVIYPQLKLLPCFCGKTSLHNFPAVTAFACWELKCHQSDCTCRETRLNKSHCLYNAFPNTFGSQANRLHCVHNTAFEYGERTDSVECGLILNLT